MRKDPGINGDAQRIEQIAWALFLKVYDANEATWELTRGFKSIIPEEYRWENWVKNDSLTGDALIEFVNNKLFRALKDLPVDENTHAFQAIVKRVFEDANNYMKDGVLLNQVLSLIDELDLSDLKVRHGFGEIYETILRELQSAGSSGEFYTPRAVTTFMAKMIKPQIGEKCADFACGTGGFLKSWLDELYEPLGKKARASDIKLITNSIYGIEKKQFPYALCVVNMLLHGIESPEIIHGNALTQIDDVEDYEDAENGLFDVVLMNPPYGGVEKDDVKGHFPAEFRSSETADLFIALITYRLKPNGRAAVIIPDGFLFGADNAKIAIKKRLLEKFNLHTIVRMPKSVFAPYTSITTNILFFENGAKTESTWFYRLDMPDGYKNFSKTKPMKFEHFAPVVEWWNDRREIVEDGFDKAKRYSVEELAAKNYNLDLCGYPREEETILPPDQLIRQYKEERARLTADIDRVLAQISNLLGFELD